MHRTRKRYCRASSYYRLALLAIVAITPELACGLGCSRVDPARPSDPTIPSTGSAARVTHDVEDIARSLFISLKEPADIALCVSEGNGQVGFNAFVFRNGTCSVLLNSGTLREQYRIYGDVADSWRMADFSLPSDVSSKLLSLVRRLAPLARQYDGAAQDGTVLCVAMDVDGQRKEIYCNNHFPEEVVQLRNFVFKEIITANVSRESLKDAEANWDYNLFVVTASTPSVDTFGTRRIAYADARHVFAPTGRPLIAQGRSPLGSG